MVGHCGGGVSVGGLFHTSTPQEPFGPFTPTLEKVAGSMIEIVGVRRAVLVGGRWQRRQWVAPRPGCVCKQSLLILFSTFLLKVSLPHQWQRTLSTHPMPANTSQDPSLNIEDLLSSLKPA